MTAHIEGHIKAVFFDHDDTLVGTHSAKSAQHKFVAKTYYNKTLTDKEIKEHWGKPLSEILLIFYGTNDLETATAINKKHLDDFPKNIFSASIPTLNRIKETGRLVGIVTATHRYNFEKDLLNHNVPKELIDYTQTQEDSKFHKPDPRVFEPAIKFLEQHDIKPNEVIYIGDGIKDLEAAIGAGFNFIGVETGLINSAEFEKNGSKSIPSLDHLIVKDKH
jgi:phosphoglycolate phosphatase-like HAD superfamily hydrolase